MDEAERWREVRRVFEELVQLPEPERARALAAESLEPSLLSAVKRMLGADEPSHSRPAGTAEGAPEAPPETAPGDASGDASVAGSEGGSAASRKGLRRLGRYELLSLLGRGGMGEVHRAHDHVLDRPVALKLLAPRYTDDPRWLARFRREARAAGAVNHPSILTIHEIGETAGVHYIATELIEGETLRERLARGSLQLAEALDIAQQVAGALAAAHAAGIVHRDVKPENVMLRRDGFVKVLDFGLAKALPGSELAGSASQSHERAVTSPGMVLGTLAYLSPEQARGQEADARSDVFGLGVVLYEMLTGSAPFRGESALDVLFAILQREHAPLAPELERAAPGLSRILERALAKDRSARQPDGAALHAELRALQASELRLASVEGRSYTPATSSISAQPPVHYAQSGDLNIAFQVFGDGPLDLVFVMGWVSHLEYFWSEPSFARFLRRLASFSRVILFDKRGTGLSDRVPNDQLPNLEQRMDDVRAVMDAAGSRRAVLCGISEGGPMCSLFAATYPERTIALVMIGSYARRLRDADYPWGPTVEERERFLDEIRRSWGGPVGIEARAPSLAHDTRFREWWAAYLRHGASPTAAVALTRMNAEVDIRRILPTVRVPTLVVHRTGDRCLVVEEGRFLAQRIPGARFVELPGIDHLPFVGAQDEILDTLEAFLADVTPSEAHDSVLATVLVAHHAGGGAADTSRAERFGVLAAREIGLLQGRLQERGPARALATFDGPARAIRVALNLAEGAARAGLTVRLGLHTGECDVLATGLGGRALEVAAEVAARAPVGGVLVSGTVRDLVGGGGLRFAPRPPADLGEGLGEVRLFAVERAAQ